MNYRITIKQLLLLAGDFLVFQAAVPVMLFLRYGQLTSELYDQHALPFLVISLIWLVGFYVAGLYDLKLTKDRLKFLRTYFEGTIANLLLSLAFFYLIPVFGITPRTNLVLYFVVVLLLDYLWRLGFNRLIAKTLLKTRLLFIGAPQDAAEVDALVKDAGLGFELVAVLQTSPGERHSNDICWYETMDSIQLSLKNDKIDTILVGHDTENVPGLQDALYHTLFTQVRLLDRPGFEEIATGRVPLDHISHSWFLSHLHEAEKMAYEGIKRVVDIAFAIVFGIFVLILFPFIALVVRLSSPGPILIRQKRVGLQGRVFTLYKFRTMVDNAEQMGKPQFAVSNDPRITKVGSFLRKTRLDELPQVWNIIRGDMSFIGPRPERPEFVEELTLQVPYYALRHLTRPGLSGWAQINFPYASTLDDNLRKLQYDLYYIKHRSLILDLSILLKTIRIVLKRAGT